MSCLFSSVVLDPDIRCSSQKQAAQTHGRVKGREMQGDDSGHAWFSLTGVHPAVDRRLDGPSLLEEREGPGQFLHPLPDGAG